jgi:hypothetical protein
VCVVTGRAEEGVSAVRRLEVQFCSASITYPNHSLSPTHAAAPSVSLSKPKGGAPNLVGEGDAVQGQASTPVSPTAVPPPPCVSHAALSPRAPGFDGCPTRL